MSNSYQCKCNKCGHKWIKRTAVKPAMCPKCKTRYWSEVAKRKALRATA